MTAGSRAGSHRAEQESVGHVVIGREAERTAISAMLDAVLDGPIALLLDGEAGIGKTTLVDAAVADASARSFQVLTCRPARSERRLSFAAVSDLLAGAPEEILAGLPRPQRHALEVALLRTEPEEGTACDVRSVAAGFLSVVCELAACMPVVIVVDDVQWIDPPSGRVLEFALRRLANRPVGVIVAARTPNLAGTPFGLERVLPEARRRRMTIGPLSLAALHHVLRTRLGHVFVRPVLVRIATESRGNPSFALEIARAALESGFPSTDGGLGPLPGSLREVLTHRLGRLPIRTRAALLLVAAADQPTAATMRSLLERPPQGDVLAPAVRAGVLEVDRTRIRFSHPLLASAVYGAASEDERRRVHRRLSVVADDPEERARHLGLATDGPDEKVALTLDSAARRAWSRGAPDAAADLARRARLMTPAVAGPELHRRSLAEADFLRDAGDLGGAASLLRQLVEGLPRGTMRPAVLWRLGNLELDEQRDGFSGVETLIRALSEAAGDVWLTAAIERDLAWATHLDLESRALHAQRSVELAELAGDTALLAEARTVQALAEFLRGHGFRRDVLDRAVAETRSTEHLPASRRPAAIYPLLLKWTDDVDAARMRYEAEHRRILELGLELQLPDILWQLSELETWAGNLVLAERYAHACHDAAVLTGRPAVLSWALYARALADAHLGRVERARAAGEEGLAVALKAAFAAGVVANLGALGFLDLSLGDLAGAHGRLEKVTALIAASGLVEPSPVRVLPDAIEALVGLGRLDDAAALLDPFENLVETLDRAWAMAAAARCRGLLAAAQGDLAGAFAALERALARYRQLPYPFESARTLLAIGQLHRRAKERRAAADVLTSARAEFARLGSRLWAEKAQAELGRVGLRPAAPGDLTATEARVAELAASGLTTREVAHAAFLSPKSVEGVLGRIYAKLGIRSRAELGARMAARAGA